LLDLLLGPLERRERGRERGALPPAAVAAALETAAKGSAQLTGGAGRIAPARPRALARRRGSELPRHGFAERARRLLRRRLGRRGPFPRRSRPRPRAGRLLATGPRGGPLRPRASCS